MIRIDTTKKGRRKELCYTLSFNYLLGQHTMDVEGFKCADN